MESLIPDPIDDQALCIKWPKTDFLDDTVTALGAVITPDDGFDNGFAMLVATLPDPSVITNVLSPAYDAAALFGNDLLADSDPELAHAIDALDSDIQYRFGQLMDFAGLKGFAIKEPPTFAAATGFTPGTLQAINIDPAGLENSLVAAVIAKLPTTPGGTPTHAGPAAANPSIGNPPATTPAKPGIGGTSSQNGLMSIDNNATLAWFVGPMETRNIEIYSQKNDEGIQLFASGNSGNQPAPWMLEQAAAWTFTLRAGGQIIDTLRFIANPLFP